MSTGALWQRPARELARLIADGEVSATEAVEAHIARIEAVNPALNAVCWKRYEEARSEARIADQLRASGAQLAPLHGVPITVKECLDLEGSPSTFGLPSRANIPAERDDPYVARLRAAGAIIVGKTNVSQLLFFVEADNPLYGRTNNPWNLERTPGGSSGGQAAIIAAGGSPLGIGTDIGGSNRVPAAFSGIVGMKATAGRLPDQGRLSMPIGQRAIVSQVGVFARDVVDLGLGLEILNGGRSPAVEPPMPLGDPAGVDLSKLRVACFTDDGVLAACPAARRAVKEAADILRGAGAQVSEWRPPDIGEAVSLIYSLFSADGAAGFKRRLGSNRRDARMQQIVMAAGAPSAMLPAIRALLRLSGRAKTAEVLGNYGHKDTDWYWQLVERLMDYQERWQRALDADAIDLILSPAGPLPAVRHRATLELGIIGGFVCLYNVLGYPAGIVPVTSVRAGEESDRAPSKDKLDQTARASEEGSAGLPICVQIAARPWREHVAIAAMTAVERAAKQRPDYPHLSKLWT